MKNINTLCTFIFIWRSHVFYVDFAIKRLLQRGLLFLNSQIYTAVILSLLSIRNKLLFELKYWIRSIQYKLNIRMHNRILKRLEFAMFGWIP